MDTLVRTTAARISVALALLATLATLASNPLLAAPATASDSVPGPEETRRVLDAAAAAIEANYVEPAAARRIAAALRARDWPTDDRGALADAVTAFLKEHDRHFNLSWRPDPTPTASQDPQPAFDFGAASALRNHGVRRAEVLRGGIGVLRLDEFAPAELVGDTLAGAMAMLAGSRALVIDLRGNGGGDPATVQLLCSWLLPPGVLLNSLYWRPGERTDQFWTLPVVPGRRLLDTPVWVLTSARTASAGEEFAMNIKTTGRGALVGETTYGAANPGDQFPLGGGWHLFVSTGKAINPVTGGNWEAVGVAPDLAVPAAVAMHQALQEALRHLTAQHADNPQLQRELAWAQAALSAERQPAPVAPTGRWGDRQLRTGSDGLVYQRDQRPPLPLRGPVDGWYYPVSNDWLRLQVRDGTLVEETVLGSRRELTPGAATARVP